MNICNICKYYLCPFKISDAGSAKLAAAAGPLDASDVVLDVGTGEAKILIAVLRAFPLAQGIGVEVNGSLARIARRRIAAAEQADTCNIIDGTWPDGHNQ